MKYEISFSCGDGYTVFATTTRLQYAEQIAELLIKTERKVKTSIVMTKTVIDTILYRDASED